MADGRLLVENRVESKPFQVLSTSLVKPAVETPREKRWHAFSNLDIIWMPFYTQAMSVYKATEAGRDVGKRLRESLQRALTLFYPLAGRVVTESNEHGAAGMLCNDAGAVFVEASIDADLEEFQYENFQPSFRLTGMAEAGLGDYPRLPDDPAGRPALIVQMTHFRCGGITLAFNWAHPVADGFSGFHFLKSWAELARGEEVSLLPVHDRALVKPRKRLILSNPFTGGHPELQTSDGEQTLPQRNVEEKLQTTPMVQVVEITKQDIEEMKREVESGASGESPRLSRVCCVSAYLWRAIVKARELPGADLSRFWTLVEGRKKMSLPAGYFGNAIGGLYATTTVSNLLNKPLAYSASLVHASIQHCTKEWYLDLVDWIEAKKDWEYPGLVLGADHECGSSWQNRFPYYELDFGFGVPVCSARNANAAWDGFFVFLPSSQSPENYTAMLHATPDVMKKFLPMVHNFSYSS
ncbi:hypothetical protein KC19_5G027000 [Ceratodon purpureus]|uniref:Uncharacterized protein n=1 Tax=Ceratodon purpureus TaxID=3225 RepID=A0A8T0HX91_CERPU|nr:hypothetical protein KC19_5G027000 [Ceratodon purpureus]